MSKFFAFCCFFCVNAAAYSPGPQINEYAHNPLTPGYGISNYFELMPDKVQPNNKVAWPVKKVLPQGIKSATIAGNMIRLEFQISYKQEPPQIFLYTCSGKKVYQFLITSKQSSGKLLLMPFPDLAKGVYFVRIETKTEKINTKIVYFGR